MATALVGVTTGVMKPLLSKLSKLLEEEYHKLRGVSKEIRFLRDELSAMSSTLQMLADAQDLNPQLKDWRDKLRELAYDMEDCVDAFVAHENHKDSGPTAISGLLRKFKKLVKRHGIAKEIEELKARAIEVSERHKRYNFFESASSSSTLAIDPRLPALFEEIDRLVGIDGPKKHIISWLTDETKEKGSSEKRKVVSLVGCGGLGKTTLANQVYSTISSQFSCAAFVSVSQNPNMKKILRDIARGVGVTDNKGEDIDEKKMQPDNVLYAYHDCDEEQLISKIRIHLRKKRYFVVVDDVWDAKVWEILKLALLNNDCGSRIITTTRSVIVATGCSSQGGYVYQMGHLSFDDSKRLFCVRAFGSEKLCYPHLNGVLDRILRKCGGLPLAIITVSSMLADQPATAEWDRVLDFIGSGLANNPEAVSMTNILSLSYLDLPHHLKTCLLYLSVFPEDYEIQKEILINRWIAEGFIHEEQRQTAYELGERYFNDLINRSLIQPIGVKYGQAEACRVHDIILDYIKCKAAEENFITSLDAPENEYISEYRVRRLSVDNRGNGKNVIVATSLVLSHVRSLTLFGHGMQTPLFHFIALRVLDLEACLHLQDRDLENIEKLFHLRYLRLVSESINNLPLKIGELQYLETLDIRGTRIRELPSTIAKLQRLSNLYVRWRTKFSDGMIGKLQSLEELETFGVWSFKIGKALNEFSQLTKLRRLVVSLRFNCLDPSEQGIQDEENLHSNVGTLISSCNLLRHLSILDYDDSPDLDTSLDSWCPASRCRLQKLHITYCFIHNVPNWMRSLENLRELKLCISCMKQEDFGILGAIPSLMFLELKALYGTNGRIIVTCDEGFRSLKYFSISLCEVAIEFETGSMPKVEHLRLLLPPDDNDLKCLNCVSGFGIQRLCNLTNVEVEIEENRIVSLISQKNGKAADGIIKCVRDILETAFAALPNRPTLSLIRDIRSDRLGGSRWSTLEDETRNNKKH